MVIASALVSSLGARNPFDHERDVGDVGDVGEVEFGVRLAMDVLLLYGEAKYHPVQSFGILH